MKVNFISGFLFKALVCLCLLSCTDSNDQQQSHNSSQQIVKIKVAYGPELRPFINKVAPRLESQPLRLATHALVSPTFIEIPGLLASNQISSGKTKVDAWITQRTMIELTNNSIKNLGARQVDCTPLFATPIVLATKQNTVNALSAASGEIPFSAIENLAGSNTNLGKLVFRLEHPQKTSLGLNSLIQLDHLASLKDSFSDLIFENTSGYNSSTEELLDQAIAKNTPHHLFVVASERAVVRANLKHNVPDYSKLQALYPDSGAVWHDFQICRSDVEWVNASKQAAIKILAEFFLSAPSANLAAAEGYRPANESDQTATSIKESNGVNPKFPSKNILPPKHTDISKLLSDWDKKARPLAVSFVVDTSGSFEEEGLTKVTAAMQKFISRLSAEDLISIVTVSTEASVLLKPTSDREKVGDAFLSMESIGGTAFYDGLLKASQIVSRSTPKEYRTLIIGVLDGPDKNSSTSTDLIRHTLRQAMIGRVSNMYFFEVTDNQGDFTDLNELSSNIYAETITTSLDELGIKMEKIWFEQ